MESKGSVELASNITEEIDGPGGEKLPYNELV